MSVENINWTKKGILNTFEQILTRAMDALTSLAIISFLAPEKFSELALAQAYIAPVLLLFVSPETSLYPHFEKWKTDGGRELATRLAAFRWFGWGKAQLCLLLAFILPLGIHLGGGYWQVFASFLWGFAVMVGPQWMGTDREYLRLSLKMKLLNGLTLFQKGSLLVFSLVALVVFKEKILALAIAAGLSGALSAALFYFFSRRVMKENLISIVQSPDPIHTLKVIRETVMSYSLWHHLSGVIWGWVQTMDVFFLGLFHLPTRAIGLYASTLKVANLSQALPLAVGNYFSIWTGRQKGSESQEFLELRRFSWILLTLCISQFFVLAILSPFIIQLLSRGRWSDIEMHQMRGWMMCMVLGSSLLSVCLPLNSWLLLRRPIQKVFKNVYGVWLALTFLIYGLSVFLGGVDTAAWANVIVGGLFSLLTYLTFKSQKQTPGAPV